MSLKKIVRLDIDNMNKHYEAEAIPALTNFNDSALPAFDIYFDNEYSGTIIKDNDFWTLNNYMDNDLLKIVRKKLYPFFLSE